jgi:DNA-binding response OmpR family regulator
MNLKYQRLRVVFCVDDDPDMLAIITAMLQRRSYVQIHRFADAHTAINAIDDMLPDLVLFDVIMPDMDGITAYKKIRDNPRYDGIRIAFVTGRKRQACMDQYMMLDVPVLTKPFNLAEFENFLKVAL